VARVNPRIASLQTWLSIGSHWIYSFRNPLIRAIQYLGHDLMAKHVLHRSAQLGPVHLKQWSLLQNHLKWPSEVMESRKMFKVMKISIPSFGMLSQVSSLQSTSMIAFKKSSKTSMSARTHITQMWLYSFSIKIAIAFWLPIPQFGWRSPLFLGS